LYPTICPPSNITKKFRYLNCRLMICFKSQWIRILNFCWMTMSSLTKYSKIFCSTDYYPLCKLLLSWWKKNLLKNLSGLG
jgi:hypothetical protein